MVIKKWIDDGTMPSENQKLLKELESQLQSTKDRREAMLAIVDELRNQYAQRWNAFEKEPWHKVPETWELKEDIQLALDDIYDYVRDTRSKIDGTFA